MGSVGVDWGPKLLQEEHSLGGSLDDSLEDSLDHSFEASTFEFNLGKDRSPFEEEQ